MRLPNDPIRFFVRAQRLTLAGGAALIIAVGAWALWPVTVQSIETPSIRPTSASQSQEQSRPVIDPHVFAVNLWHAPPPEKEPESAVAIKPPEPAKPLRLQLIGIINEAGVRRAALYDMDTDRLLILSSGDHIRENTVKSITDKSVELTDGRITRQLTLAESSIASGDHS